MKPKVLFAIPEGPLKAHMFSKDWRQRLDAFADVKWNELGRDLSSEELAVMLPGCEALITGWGSPKITDEVLDAARELRAVLHCAGTVRPLVDESFFSRGIVLTNANLALAPSVAEYCLMTALMARWQVLTSISRVKNGAWQTNNDVVPGLNGCAIGLIGYGAITREFIRLLKPFDVEIRVHSGHLSAEEANELGVESCSLEEAMRCDVVSVHSTLTERTRGMIDANMLTLMPDGGILINTARGPIVDEAALIRELSSGRIGAVLDVFDQEPLPENHPLRSTEHAIVTPHSAGTSIDRRRKMAELVLGDLKRALRGEQPEGVITLEKYLSMTPC